MESESSVTVTVANELAAEFGVARRSPRETPHQNFQHRERRLPCACSSGGALNHCPKELIGLPVQLDALRLQVHQVGRARNSAV